MPDLRAYQDEDAEFLLSALRERDPYDRVRFNLNEPGLGKTVVGAAVCGRLPAERPVLVVCPTAVRTTWAEELQRWAPSREVVTFDDTFTIRRPDPGQVTVLGYDQLGTLRAPRPPNDPNNWVTAGRYSAAKAQHERRLLALRSLADLQHGTVIIADEAQYAKGARTKRSLELEDLWKKHCRPRGGAYLPLSGTIDPCSPVDLWVALEVAGVATRVWPGGITACLEGHFGGRYDKQGRRWTFPDVPPGGSVLEGEVGRRMRRYVIRRTQEEVLGELPQPRRLVTLCPVAGEARRLADRLLEAAVASAGATVEQNAGAVLEALARKARPGATDLGLLSEARAALAELKIPVLRRRVAELRKQGLADLGDPLVVASEHRAPVDDIRTWVNDPGLPPECSIFWGFITGAESRKERDEVLDSLRRNALAGVAITGAGRVGITLIESRYMIKVSSSWSHDDEVQFEKRVIRYGQKREVTIESIVADHPVEAAVLGVVGRKATRGAVTWGRSGSSTWR